MIYFLQVRQRAVASFLNPDLTNKSWDVHLYCALMAYRDNSCTTSDRFVNWTAASETHQRKSNIFIIQQNKRNVKDRSFSRKIESERSFFIPLKRILLRRFEGLIRCVRERRYYGSHIKDSEKSCQAGIFLLKIKEEPDYSDSSKYVSANTYPNCYL